MKRLVVVACVMLLLLKLEGFNCSDKMTLIIPPSKYAESASTLSESSYCGLSPSEIASLSATNLIPSSSSSNITTSLVKAISTSPYILSSLSPPLVYNFLNGLSSSPSLLQSVEPSTVASLIKTLSASPSLLKDAPCCTVVNFINAITICPKIISALPPSTLIRILIKLYAETPCVLYGLSPAVKVSLIHVILSPEVLSTLKPTEITFLINFFISSKYTLAELPPTDIIRLLETIASSQILLNNIPTTQIVNFLYRVSKLAPFLLGAIPTNVIDILLIPIVSSIRNQSPTTLINLATILSSSPYLINAIDPSIVSSLLNALSPPDVLRTVPPVLLIKLLTEISLSNGQIKTIGPEAIIGILYSIKSTSPSLMSDIPPSVRSTYVIDLTTAEVASALSIEMSVKLIDTLIDNPSFLVGLSSSSINKIINLMISIDMVLSSIPLKKIVGFIHNITVLSPFVLRETPENEIRKILSPLTSISSLNSLDPCSYAQFLSSISNSPSLLSAISDEQIANILTTLNSSTGILKEVPSKILINILTLIFTSPTLLPKIPPTLLLNFLIKIENYSPCVLCSIPSFAIATFMDYLGEDPATLTSLSPPDIRNLLYILTKIPSFLTQVSVKTLSALLDSIAASSAVLYNIPVEIKINLFYSIYSQLPSIFCSLPPQSLREIANSINSFETLSSLSLDRKIELITVMSECPCLLSILDPTIVTNLINVLSTSESTLSTLKPRTIVNLITSISSNDTLSASVPASSYIHFLKALSTAAPCTICCIPASVYAILLKSLGSIVEINNLTSTDVDILVDMLIETSDLLTVLPPTLIVNLIEAISKTFTSLSHMKIILLLASIHSVSPSIMCLVPVDVLTDLLNSFVTSSDLCGLPPKFIVALAAVLSSSSCLMDAMSAAAFDSFLSLLSTSPAILQQIPVDVLGLFFTKLSLAQPPVLKNVKLSLLVSLLSSVLAGPEQTATAIPSIVIRTLLVPLSDAKTIYDLEPTDVATLISIAASSPRILDAITGAPLNVLLSKVASSPRLLSFVSPALMTSFFGALTSSPTAFGSVQPTTLVNLLTTVAISQPTAVSALPPSVATALLRAFDSQRALASLSPPVLNSLVCLLLAFPNLLAALPLTALVTLLQFLSSTPAVLDALPSCTIAKLLAALSSLPPLLRVLPPGLLTSFLSALSTVAPTFLGTLPSAVVTTLFGSVTSASALASSTPASIASLISTLDRSPCLLLVLPTSILVSFLSYLSSHPGLLKNTSKNDLLSLINNIRSPDAIPRVPLGCPPCAVGRFGEDFASFLSLGSPTLSACSICNCNENVASDGQNKMCCLPATIPLPKCQFICALPEDSLRQNASEKYYNREMPIDLMPKLIMPENAKKAKIYVYKKDEKPSSSENISSP